MRRSPLLLVLLLSHLAAISSTHLHRSSTFASRESRDRDEPPSATPASQIRPLLFHRRKATQTRSPSPKFVLVSSPSSQRRFLTEHVAAADRHAQPVAQRARGDSKTAALFPRIPETLARAEPKPPVAATSQQESPATEGDDPIERANIVGRAELYVADGMGAVKDTSSSLLASPVLAENGQSPVLTEVNVGLDGLVVESPCDSNEGFWEEDSDWPLYKAGDCPLIWNTGNQCMENGRPDTLYQRLRYKQPRCPAPKLTGNTLCSLLANRSIAFVGDSLTENMFESLICLLHRFQGSPVPVNIDQKERVLTWRACNVTVAFYWSAFLTNLSLSEPGEHSKGGQLDLSHVDMHWGRHVAEHDIFVINTAHWWSPQRLWLGGIPFSPPTPPLPPPLPSSPPTEPPSTPHSLPSPLLDLLTSSWWLPPACLATRSPPLPASAPTPPPRTLSLCK
ncbi:hypothetical protein CLOM_g3709 [Closterium sp. NIES-68]|nr:hypothetical protein CLOM_g3709 [Closterium sp. NIES-68]